MEITFLENGETTNWILTAEEERLINVVRNRLTVEDPVTKTHVPRFTSVSELIHQNVIDAFIVPTIQEETREQFQANLNATIESKINGIPKPVKAPPKLAQNEKTLFEKFKTFIGMES